MENRSGLNLTWFQVIVVCAMLLGGFSASLIRADGKQSAENRNQDNAIKCKLDKTSFKQYTTAHNLEYRGLVKEFQEVKNQVQESEKQMIERVNRSEKEIIRILTRMENK